MISTRQDTQTKRMMPLYGKTNAKQTYGKTNAKQTQNKRTGKQTQNKRKTNVRQNKRKTNGEQSHGRKHGDQTHGRTSGEQTYGETNAKQTQNKRRTNVRQNKPIVNKPSPLFSLTCPARWALAGPGDDAPSSTPRSSRRIGPGPGTRPRWPSTSSEAAGVTLVQGLKRNSPPPLGIT